MEDTPKKMLKAATSFFSGTMLSRITGMLRDVAMAFAFGTEASLAAFFVAFRLAHLLRRLFGEGPLQSAFIPHFETLRKEEAPQRAMRLFIDLYAALSLILIVLIAIGMAACAALLYGYGQSWNTGTEEIFRLCLLMLPSLLFICLSGLNTALLQCERSYFLPAVAPVAFNLLWIFGVFVLQAHPSHEAMPKLALCIVAACFGQWVVTLPKVYKLLQGHGFHFKVLSALNPLSADIKTLWRPFLLGMIGIGAGQINSALDALFARFAESSGPAYLWYAIRLQQLPLALFGIALSGALLPPLTRAIKGKEQTQSGLLFNEAVYRAMLLIFPITAALFILGQRFVDVLYGYGDFGPESILGTTYCLWGYTLGLIPMTLVLIAAPVFYAQNDYRTPSRASIAAMLINGVLNAVLVLQFQLGAFSIALATSVSAWVNLACLVMPMDPFMQKAFWAGLKKCWQATCVPFAISCALTLSLARYLPPGDAFASKFSYAALLGVLFCVCFIVKLWPKKAGAVPP